MKTTSMFSSIVIAGLGVVSSASALPIVQNAAEFHAVLPADQASIVYTPDGVSNASSTPKDVIGMVARNPHAEGTQQVSVIGFNDDESVTTTCTIYAITQHPLYGVTTVAKSFTVSVFNHTWTRSQWFTTAEAGPMATYQVRCTLAGNNKSRIQSVRTAQ